ncbi:ABC transporter ATPase [Polaribacter tangerinus]|uniref:ABC transporter ATPase n=1 Tax=Polaribacter tangerinus TaxID=1920034 RepID=UPI000B4B7DB3|nr:ABC transporter ATPase [Polaribacter tangerinus]
MYTEYTNLPDSARIWIYQSNREFSQQEIAIISEKAIDFINTWTRHGDDIKGSFTIKYNHFLVLAVDESYTNVSGCSIDSSVRFIKQIEDEFKVDLMNKMNISFKIKNTINIVKLPDFQRYVKEGKVDATTIVFNNMVDSKGALENSWEISASESWHQRFLQ